MLETEHDHSKSAIKARLAQGPAVSYLREWVYGGIDGVVTTFAIVAGVAGASLSPLIVVILGVANLVGDGFSMAAGAFSSTRTETDNYQRLRAVENRHIDRNPQGEREEVRQIYQNKGFSGADLEHAVDTITSNREQWIATMMSEEYGLAPVQASPVKAAVHTFLAFVICGAMPLLPYIAAVPQAFYGALGLSALTFFGIGAMKSRWSVTSWWRHGLETLAVGMMAAGLAFAIGYGLRDLAG